jgi:hypothetical protein
LLGNTHFDVLTKIYEPQPRSGSPVVVKYRAKLMAERAANQEVWVTIKDLKTGDVIKPATRRYVAVSIYQDRQGNFVADVIGEDGLHTSFTDIPGANAGFTARIGTDCTPTLEALKRFIAGSE